ncbi:MAG TPA: aminotransferase class V-fold PLP-dependent enzyme [Candidatus Udaeobacter sp.]|nr:aminotransferase class V-fold PLP-dependent enzyme [Candidatus Udaeobacter sp.]
MPVDTHQTIMCVCGDLFNTHVTIHYAWMRADRICRSANVRLRIAKLQAGLPASRMTALGDTSPEEFRKQLHELADWIADFRQNLGSLPVAPNDKSGAVLAALSAEPPEHGELFGQILRDVNRNIVPGMVHWSHPMFLGYFGWTTTAPAILGEIITAPLNVNAMTWRTCPAATELETLVVDWIRQWMHLPEEFGGIVYDTASVGVMHALAVAREEAAPTARKRGLVGAGAPVFRIYASEQAHSSAEKAAIALGLGEENVQRVPTDAHFCMDSNALREMITRDVRDDFKPLAVIATVGTTSTGSVDPVAEIAKLCRENKMWLHIDGAYGAGFAILPENKWLTNGWSEADSIVVNPHKSLFVPLDFSVLYVRDLERLRRVFTLVPEYLRGDTVETQKNYMDYGIQLGRRFRALKAWVIFRSFGREGMAARLREFVRLANVLAEWIRSDDRFELTAPVSMGVVCFRWVRSVAGVGDARPGPAPPATAEEKLDQLNSEIVEKINEGGRAYLTQTKLRGRTVMRIGLGNVLTTEDHLRKAWELIQETASAL